MTRYEGATEAIPLNYFLLSVRGKVGTGKNRGDRGRTDGSGCGGRAIVDQRYNLVRFMMHGKMTASGAELAGKKTVINRGRGRGSGLAIPPRRLGWPSRGLWGG